MSGIKKTKIEMVEMFALADRISRIAGDEIHENDRRVEITWGEDDELWFVVGNDSSASGELDLSDGGKYKKNVTVERFAEAMFLVNSNISVYFNGKDISDNGAL